jgi:signal transduction histidine kinase
MDLSIYRIVQEAVTNAVKHAEATRVQCTIHYHLESLEIDISDNGRGSSRSAASLSSRGTGHGIVGMRERVGLFGGRFDAGQVPGGGFRVHAVLPLAGD